MSLSWETNHRLTETELRRLKGVDPDGGLVFGSEERDFWEDQEPGLRILPAEEKPLNPTLLRWNKNCERWLPTLKKIEVGVFWAICTALMVAFWVYFIGKGMRWW